MITTDSPLLRPRRGFGLAELFDDLKPGAQGGGASCAASSRMLAFMAGRLLLSRLMVAECR
ncbi:MAG: hypothetical protein U5M50_06775 [Sphingobium sp.]|nr:hypothetical protein [Sphingobium sp.]